MKTYYFYYVLNLKIMEMEGPLFGLVRMHVLPESERERALRLVDLHTTRTRKYCHT